MAAVVTHHDKVVLGSNPQVSQEDGRQVCWKPRLWEILLVSAVVVFCDRFKARPQSTWTVIGQRDANPCEERNALARELCQKVLGSNPSTNKRIFLNKYLFKCTCTISTSKGICKLYNYELYNVECLYEADVYQIRMKVFFNPTISPPILMFLFQLHLERTRTRAPPFRFSKAFSISLPETFSSRARVCAKFWPQSLREIANSVDRQERGFTEAKPIILFGLFYPDGHSDVFWSS